MQGRVHLRDFPADEAPQACEWGAQTLISRNTYLLLNTITPPTGINYKKPQDACVDG